MKITLILLVCCILTVVGTIVFAPEYAHEIIDKLHENTTETDKSRTTNGNKENNKRQINKKNTVSTPTESVDESKEKQSHNDKDPDTKAGNDMKRKNDVKVTTPPQPIKHPRTRNEMLTWLHENNYSVGIGDGFYRITWHYRKPFTSRPNAIIFSRDGTVSIRHEQLVVIDEDGATIIGGRNVDIKGSGCIMIGVLIGGIRQNGFYISSVSTKYRNGYYWVEFKRSFDWILGRHSIENVWSKAKKLKEVNHGN